MHHCCPQSHTASSSAEIQSKTCHCTRAFGKEEVLVSEVDQTHGFHHRLRHDQKSEMKRSTEIESCNTELHSNHVIPHLDVGLLCENNVCGRVVESD